MNSPGTQAPSAAGFQVTPPADRLHLSSEAFRCYTTGMRALIIGGTRNLGPSLVTALLQAGYETSVFNRGKTPAELPRQVERLCGDRGDPQVLRAVLGKREFELVVDTTLYTGRDAEPIVDLLLNRTGRYIFISTGQVYLVRVGPKRPYREEDYAGPVMPAPPQSAAYDYDNWVYGIEKRAAEDVLMRGWAERRFPVTTLRLPMVNSEHDHFNRIYGYYLRLRDGGPILIPEGPGLPLRHVYGEDVVQAVLRLAGTSLGLGRAYNISQDETLSLEAFLGKLAHLANAQSRVVRIPRERLNQLSLLPACSPFSGTWMSVLDNARSVTELGMKYTPFVECLDKLVRFFESSPERQIEAYTQRALELKLAAESAGTTSA
jgi:nucleoside-diphosphate-sugar epimerase